ncbi:MAG: Histone H1-like nucleoprotein [Acidobacteriota bacterium]|nr:Histone H1-like nucleoprotein [Acidobacteriota bacterium]
MSKKRTVTDTGAVASTGAGAADEGESKAALQQQLEETRDSISETVAEIKSVVTHQYEEVRDTVESVKDGVGEVLDWRADFERNPLVWGAGAVSIGILVGFGIARAFDNEDSHTRGRGKRSVTTGEHVIAELSGFAEVVLPTISSKVKELFGLDLDAYLRAAHTSKPAPKQIAKKASTRKSATKKAATKKGSASKSATKKGAARKGAAKKSATKKKQPKKK